MQRFSKSREEAEINVTPMLDIVFIMLIFFIVTATFARERGLLAHTPAEAPPRQDDPPENCLVEVSNTNRLSLNHRQTDLGGLRSLLARCRAQNAKAAVIIRMAPDSEAGYMVRIANLALEAGVPQQKIFYARGDNTMLMRFSGSMPPAAIMTFGLFFLMQILVVTGNTELDETEIIVFPNMISIPERLEIRDDIRDAEFPEELDTPPPLDPSPPVIVERGPTGPAIPTAPAEPDPGRRGGFGVKQDGEFVPVARFEPRYPRRAAERETEGETVVRFTITETGATEGCAVLSEEPRGYGFGAAACRAVEKWKYRPRIVGGEALPVVGVQTLLTFRLAEE